MWWGVRKAVGSLVALRKESVDRNLCLRLMFWPFLPSLSARRAWIEIANPGSTELTFPGRSPQGERG